MALVTCPDCGKEVSDQAASCPGCARPLGQNVMSLGRGPVQMVEQTSKKWKAPMLVCIGVTALGGAIFASGGDGRGFGGLIAILGLVGFLVTRIGAWWQHG